MALATTLAPAPVHAPAPSPGSRAVAPRARPRRMPPRRAKLGPVGSSHHVAPERSPVQLTRRGVVACWLAAIVSMGVIAFGFFQGLQPSTPAVAGAQSVTVESGASLWDLAKQVNPDVDPRVTIAAIREANGLDPAAVVQAGTTVAVPVYAPDE